MAKNGFVFEITVWVGHQGDITPHGGSAITMCFPTEREGNFTHCFTVLLVTVFTNSSGYDLMHDFRILSFF